MKISDIQQSDHNEYVWLREDGTEVTVSQFQGLDYFLGKEKGDHSSYVTSYSDAGFHLYSALAYYLMDRGELPSFSEVQTLDGKFTETKESGYPIVAEELLMSERFALAKKFGERIEGIMPFVAGYIQPHKSYHGLVDGERFLIVEPVEGNDFAYGKSTLSIEERFDLYSEEALNVMKVLFSNAFGADELRRFHEMLEGRL